MAVKVTGAKEAGGAKIGAVANSVTGEKDGTISIGDDVIIEGEKIKIQDEAQGYAKPYEADSRKLIKIGAVFSSEERTISEWLVGE